MVSYSWWMAGAKYNLANFSPPVRPASRHMFHQSGPALPEAGRDVTLALFTKLNSSEKVEAIIILSLFFHFILMYTYILYVLSRHKTASGFMSSQTVLETNQSSPG